MLSGLCIAFESVLVLGSFDMFRLENMCLLFDSLDLAAQVLQWHGSVSGDGGGPFFH